MDILCEPANMGDYLRSQDNDETCELVTDFVTHHLLPEDTPEATRLLIQNIQTASISRRKCPQNASSQTWNRKNNGGNTFHWVKLEHPFSTPEDLAKVANLGPSRVSPVKNGTSKTGAALFCCLTTNSRNDFDAWLATNHPSVHPTFITISKAAKELSSTSLYPTLGIDSTLPHHRLDSSSATLSFSPSQNQYPVYYFFYGTLANTDVLQNLFSSSDCVVAKGPVLHRASISDGRLRTWGDKYRALADSPGGVMKGFAYEVQSENQENALLEYEAPAYEVVRCNITLDGATAGETRTVKGCAFRFAGEEGELT